MGKINLAIYCKVNRGKTMKKSIILSCVFCTILSVSNHTYAGNSSALSEVLSKYCVPKDSSICGSKNIATYNTRLSACECAVLGMYYDVKERKCLNCPIGTVAFTKTSTKCSNIQCKPGYVGKLITNNCPAGYIKKEITKNSCPRGTTLWSFPK